MNKKTWFFKSGNARVSWVTAPEWAHWFAVDFNGFGFWFEEQPFPRWTKWVCTNGMCELACYTGEVYFNFKKFIFERAEEKA